MQKAIIFDLDGTLATSDHRKWSEYNKIKDDVVIAPIGTILNLYYRLHLYEIIVLTARSSDSKRETQGWLNNYFGVAVDRLIMKPQDYLGLNRSDAEEKRALYQVYIKGQYDVECVFEDNPECVEMWRKEGLLCCQVYNNGSV